MIKRIKIIALVLIIVIAIIAIRDFLNFRIIPNMQKEQIIKSFSKNINKFENVHKYIVKTQPLVKCYKNPDGKVHVYYTDFDEYGNARNIEMKVGDKLVLQQINYILHNLDFEYIENIGDDTYFVFRDVNGHFQSIDYTTEDNTKIEGWNCIKLKDNWYYRSIWEYFIKDEEERDFSYRLRVIFHIIRGY